jgi:hypothetical protein
MAPLDTSVLIVLGNGSMDLITHHAGPFSLFIGDHVEDMDCLVGTIASNHVALGIE